MSVHYAVTVAGQPAGEVWRDGRNWHWTSPGGKTVSREWVWRKRQRRADIAGVIARASGQDGARVEFTALPNL